MGPAGHRAACRLDLQHEGVPWPAMIGVIAWRNDGEPRSSAMRRPMASRSPVAIIKDDFLPP
jgi:hypothetical protein